MSVDKRIEEELFPFYALGSLTDAEQAEVEAYIAANPEARKRLEEWQEVTAAIPFTVEPVNPSPGVWQGLKERIDATQPSPQPTISVMDVVAGWFGRFRASLAMPILSGVSVLVAIIAIVSMVLLQAQVEKQRRVLEMIQAPGVITIGIGDVTGEHP
jgi:anti-sigma factor RsiW